MKHSIQTVYVVHHSHTDIGYTDLQERVIDTQVDYLRPVLSLMEPPDYGSAGTVKPCSAWRSFGSLQRRMKRRHFSAWWRGERLASLQIT